MRTRTFPVFFVIIIVEKMRVESEVLLILLTEDFFVEKLHFTVFACMVTRIPNFEILYTSLCHYSWWNLKIKYLLALKKKSSTFFINKQEGTTLLISRFLLLFSFATALLLGWNLLNRPSVALLPVKSELVSTKFFFFGLKTRDSKVMHLAFFILREHVDSLSVLHFLFLFLVELQCWQLCFFLKMLYM